MKSGWEKYASEKRYIQKGYLRKHSNGGSGREAREASRCDSLLCCKKTSEKEMNIEGDKHERVREEDVDQTHQEGRQGIQESDQGRCETEETNTSETKRQKVKKESAKEKKHEARETKAYEKKEDRKERKSRNK